MLEMSSSAGSSSCAVAPNGDEIASGALSELVLTFMIVQIGLCVLRLYSFWNELWVQSELSLLLNSFFFVSTFGAWFVVQFIDKVPVLCSAKGVDR